MLHALLNFNKFVDARLPLLAGIACISAAVAQPPSMTYQGELTTNGLPASGSFDLRFTLFDQATGGVAVSITACADDVQVDQGRFTAILPFTAPGTGLDSYLSIQVRDGDGFPCSDGTGFVTLAPRQRVTPAPVAAYAHAVTTTPPVVRGAVRFRPDTGQFEGYTGAFWVPFQVGTPIAPSGAQLFDTTGAHSFIVPPGIASLGVDLWAGGGGGGDGPSGFFVIAASCDDDVGAGGAGGGGAGAHLRASIDVFPGETLTVTVGRGGAAGQLGGAGATGGASSIMRGTTTLLRVLGGRGGAPGVASLATQSSPSSVCLPLTAGTGGAGGAVDVVSGLILSDSSGNPGGHGRGPACRVVGFPIPELAFCPATGGSGAPPISAGAPLPSLFFGRGGAGWSPGISNELPGSSGAVRLFWN